jgi:hypothetical protein
MAADPLKNATATPAPQLSSVESDHDPFDPLGWELPVLCKDCNKEFEVPYRHFQAGMVFHCPHCHGSYVPTLPMYRKVHETFETFYARMRRERDEMTKSVGNDAGFSERLERECAQFHDSLKRLARELRPAGKMVRRNGLGAMFT